MTHQLGDISIGGVNPQIAIFETHKPKLSFTQVCIANKLWRVIAYIRITVAYEIFFNDLLLSLFFSLSLSTTTHGGGLMFSHSFLTLDHSRSSP